MHICCLNNIVDYRGADSMKPKVSVFPRSESPGFMVLRASSLMNARLSWVFQVKGFNVTPEQWSVLASLLEIEGIHQSLLAKKTAKDRHNIARMVDLLEKRGLIRRERHRTDKRRLLVYLTAEGRELTTKLVPVVTEFLQQALSGLTQRDLGQMKRTLAQIATNLETTQYGFVARDEFEKQEVIGPKSAQTVGLDTL
jgi:MarR family transcriptional regulator, organic hydroperoxide resistance regulator